jgi:hypothetical protein
MEWNPLSFPPNGADAAFTLLPHRAAVLMFVADELPSFEVMFSKFGHGQTGELFPKSIGLCL